MRHPPGLGRAFPSTIRTAHEPQGGAELPDRTGAGPGDRDTVDSNSVPVSVSGGLDVGVGTSTGMGVGVET